MKLGGEDEREPEGVPKIDLPIPLKLQTWRQRSG